MLYFFNVLADKTMIKANDVVILTQRDYLNPQRMDHYTQNILNEDHLLTEALKKRGLSIDRTHWDNPDYDWTSSRYALFRATWDYYHRYPEFKRWLEKVCQEIKLINPLEIIQWSSDKHYLDFLQQKGINIPPTLFLKKGEMTDLAVLMKKNAWQNAILKPAIAGGARHTYRLTEENIEQHQEIFQHLVAKEDLLLQEFQHNICSKGEISFMLFGGQYSHAVLKKAKPDDFRVQDDFGGTIHDHQALSEELAFIHQVIQSCPYQPVYARIDVMWDNQMQLCLSELELIEPELWFRRAEGAADKMACAVENYIKSGL